MKYIFSATNTWCISVLFTWQQGELFYRETQHSYVGIRFTLPNLQKTQSFTLRSIYGRLSHYHNSPDYPGRLYCCLTGFKPGRQPAVHWPHLLLCMGKPERIPATDWEPWPKIIHFKTGHSKSNVRPIRYSYAYTCRWIEGSFRPYWTPATRTLIKRCSHPECRRSPPGRRLFQTLKRLQSPSKPFTEADFHVNKRFHYSIVPVLVNSPHQTGDKIGHLSKLSYHL